MRHQKQRSNETRNKQTENIKEKAAMKGTL